MTIGDALAVGFVAFAICLYRYIKGRWPKDKG